MSRSPRGTERHRCNDLHVDARQPFRRERYGESRQLYLIHCYRNECLRLYFTGNGKRNRQSKSDHHSDRIAFGSVHRRYGRDHRVWRNRLYMDARRQHIESKRGHADYHHRLYGYRKVRRGLYKHGCSNRIGEQQTYNYSYRQPGDDLPWQQLNAFGLRRSVLCLEHRRNRTCHHCNTGKYADVYRDGHGNERLF
jgi:hypothetical protein